MITKPIENLYVQEKFLIKMMDWYAIALSLFDWYSQIHTTLENKYDKKWEKKGKKKSSVTWWRHCCIIQTKKPSARIFRNLSLKSGLERWIFLENFFFSHSFLLNLNVIFIFFQVPIVKNQQRIIKNTLVVLRCLIAYLILLRMHRNDVIKPSQWRMIFYEREQLHNLYTFTWFRKQTFPESAFLTSIEKEKSVRFQKNVFTYLIHLKRALYSFCCDWQKSSNFEKKWVIFKFFISKLPLSVVMAACTLSERRGQKQLSFRYNEDIMTSS